MDDTPRDRDRKSLLGVSIDAVTLARALDVCISAVEQGEYLSIGVVNAAKIVAMRRDKRLREAVGGCRMILADGQSVVWASQILRDPLPERVAGIDLFEALLAEAARRKSRVYFLGARPDVLKKMVAEVDRRFPGIDVVGSHDGYFQGAEEAGLVADIRSRDPELLFVGISSPKKELFIQQWGEVTGARVAHGVGGSFDVLAGRTRRAPLWYQKHGLEWLYRAQQEPIRLGRRYLTTNAVFIAMVAREALRRYSRRRGPQGADEPAQTSKAQVG
jgi:N-acetylglucosaminyldiphosphoundecaprenol N-acetyl-beta-D-mannosaminyltransferase